MAIQIIGASRPALEQKDTSPLPRIDQDLPPPTTAPELKRPLGDDQLRALLAHENPLIRSYAIEQVTQLDGDAWSAELAKLVSDPSDLVAADAIHAMDARKWTAAVDAILERFTNGSGEVAAVAASALGTLAPDRLLEAVKQRGRLDDEAYAATATALAVIGSPEVVDFLDKAMNRQGALSPERRGALQGAALLSGSVELSHRVLSQAIEDSKKDEPEGASFPSRGALAAIAGLPLPFSRKAAGLELFDSARAELEATVLPELAEADRAKLEEALKTKRPGAVLAALEAVLALPEKVSTEKKAPWELGNMPRRRRGLLRAMIDRKDAIDALEVAGGAVFIAAAAQAASVVLAGEGSEAGSPALVTLVKALEDPKLDDAKLAAMTEDELTAMFEAKTERQMRRVHGILTHEEVRRAAVLRRFAKAIVRAGHGEGLFEAAADVDNPAVHDAVLTAIATKRELAEKVIVEALGRSPMEPKLARLALAGAEQVRTERIALAIGRRFSELRTLARSRLVRAILRLGDARLIPLLEARAFKDEPEEVAWTILSLAHGREATDKLKDATERANPRRALAAEHPLVLPLTCKRCSETLVYGFDRALLDLESKDKYGDPAYVGDVTCKACGAEDQLEPTEEAARILTSHMLELIQATRRGVPPDGSPTVSPAQTEVKGKRMGLAAALRTLDKEVEGSPSSIRTRLHRARIRLLLKRRHIDEDLDAVLALDPRSAEAIALRGALAARAGEHQRALDLNVEAVRLLRADPPSRVYDAPDAEAFRESLEEYILELERSRGAVAPADLDLAAARKRRDERERAMAEAEAERAEEAELDAEAARPGAPRGGAPVDPRALAAMRTAGRNDPCPCGSGQKFKKCHGRGR
ncbi:SEC-C domain-containing protein [Myxococcota bacterium]|nr:SEC-C domain-containing protein [Myxococcota bacterium]